ncbi:50S ribosomal protein L4 [Candidatus Uhrbacteria bacterium]|nr:50S ribosomal protein L4 [Candidatus Uhrbacteria bacterium]
MKTKVYNLEGNIVGEMDLPSALFEVPVREAVVHEAVRIARANARTTIAHTKTRGEVRGGGKKPWRQKGTGRARHGSIRSPIWRGGGVTFGPRSTRNYTVKINRKARRAALRMALSDRAQHDKVVLLEALALPEGKTKQLVGILNKLPLGKRTLVILPARGTELMRASKNIEKITTVTANAVSLVDVVRHDTLLMPQATIPVLETLYGKS